MGTYKTVKRTAPGPDTKLTPDMVEGARYLILKGMTVSRALQSLGANYCDISRWRKFAREGVAPYAERMGAIETAETMFLGAVEMHLGHEAMEGDWRCSDKVLSKRLPNEYGERLQLTPPATPAAELDALTDEELDAALRERGLPATVLLGMR